jgi:HK97 gp10 family phage protein
VSGVKITWNADKFKAGISAKVIDGMDRVGQFCAERASANAPVYRGVLRASVTYKVEAHGEAVEAIVGATRKAFWAWFQEIGTSKMAASPWLRPAIFGNAAEIMRRFVGKG